jgi:hypothetical protein
MTIEFSQRTASCSTIQCAAVAGQALLSKFNLQALVVADSAVGGATDG